MMNSEKIIRGILYVASVAILSALCYSFVASENQAYTWDSRFYWVVWNEYTGLLHDSFSQWLASIKYSVYSADYNPLPVIALIPFNYLPIGNREAYILGVYILYLLQSDRMKSIRLKLSCLIQFLILPRTINALQYQNHFYSESSKLLFWI